MRNIRKLFGTDGIRGKVGDGLVTPEFALELGRAAGTVFNTKSNIFIARDPRLSSEMLQAALSSGITSMGVSVCDLGVLPTPACAFLTQYLDAEAGIVISASHNPYYDNGIKFFNSKGHKLSDSQEMSLENIIFTNRETKSSISPNKIGKIFTDESLAQHYVNHCLDSIRNREGYDERIEENLKKLKIVVDCSNGATFKIAPEVLQQLGTELIIINDKPSGLNINQECGAANQAGLEVLAKKVKTLKADLGIAFDGDGDRVILVSSKGKILDGDHILYILVNEKLRNAQQVKGVVGTEMSNFGLEQAIKQRGIAFERAKVGDRYVLEKLHQNEWLLGGETSGHILNLDKASTGDGLITAMLILAVMADTRKSLDELVQGLHKYPQVMINVSLYDMEQEILENPTVKDAMQAIAEKLNDKGRLLVRKSGTEPVLRVMVEGENMHTIRSLATQLSDVIKSEIKC